MVCLKCPVNWTEKDVYSFREAVGFALDEEVEIAAVMLKDGKQPALMITRKEGKSK